MRPFREALSVSELIHTYIFDKKRTRGAAMLRIGFIGWRGMVGSVLMGRMIEEGDFGGFEPVFFTTSNIGGQGPDVGIDIQPLQDVLAG